MLSSTEEQRDGSHYAVLGMERGASAAEVRQAYRRALITAHPDKGGPRERFEQLQAAFAVLSDPVERLIYDEKLDRELGAGKDSGSCIQGAAAAAGSQLQRATPGVAAVVHGQTRGAAKQTLQPLQPPRCHQPASPCCSRLAAATDAIKALLQQLGTSQRGSPAAVSLGEAYASRAQLCKAAGQLHHALFDAEEALRLHPGLDIAAELRRELTAAIHVAEASDTGGRQTHSEGSRSSSSDDEPGGF